MALGAALLNTLLLFFHSFCFVSAMTEGSMATVSLQSEAAYQTARFCAAGCLVYNGVETCSTGSAYNDVGVFLGCGKCGPINACYCAPSLGSSATAFISSCVSLGCGESIANRLDEVTSMLSIYNGYCATANVTPTTAAVTPIAQPTVTTAPTPAPRTTDNIAVSTTPPRPGPIVSTTTTLQVTSTTTIRPATSTLLETTAGSRGTKTSGLGAAPGGTILPPQSPNNEEKAKDSLSRSDIVALAASLGVGGLSIIIAALTLWAQLRKRKRMRESREFIPTTRPHASSSTQVLLPPRQPHVQYSELPSSQRDGRHNLEDLELRVLREKTRSRVR
ncbi:hypothetical protein OQA88_2375 [Cercophora sp. LCS_1]